MNYRLIIRPEAEYDIKEAFSWYEDRKEGLGHEFLFQVKAGLTFLEKNPKACPQDNKKTRRYLIKRFPYKIFHRQAKGRGSCNYPSQKKSKIDERESRFTSNRDWN